MKQAVPFYPRGNIGILVVKSSGSRDGRVTASQASISVSVGPSSPPQGWCQQMISLWGRQARIDQPPGFHTSDHVCARNTAATEAGVTSPCRHILLTKSGTIRSRHETWAASIILLTQLQSNPVENVMHGQKPNDQPGPWRKVRALLPKRSWPHPASTLPGATRHPNTHRVIVHAHHFTVGPSSANLQHLIPSREPPKSWIPPTRKRKDYLPVTLFLLRKPPL